MAQDIGSRLRAVREASALSQRALAKNSGISNATISLIESRKLNPSVAVLKRILDGIPMHMSAFFAEDAAAAAPDGGPKFRLLADRLAARTEQHHM